MARVAHRRENRGPWPCGLATVIGNLRKRQSRLGTLADLDASNDIRPMHLNEAITDRMLDRNLWT